MNALEVFLYNDTYEFRTALIDGNPWFFANDVCNVLEVNNVSQAIARLDADEVTLISNEGRPTNVINEAGLYSLVLGSRKPSARAFKRWVTHEVLPAIRKTGSYAGLPQTFAEALELAAAQAREVEALSAKVKDDAPKVLFADSVSTSRTTILVGELAKVLRGNGVPIGQNRLFERMRDEGYLIKRAGSDWNMPTQYAMERGLFEIKETAVTHSDGHVTVNKTPKVTGKGQVYFINRYTEVA